MLKIKSAGNLLFIFLLTLSVLESCVSHEFVPYTCPDEPISYNDDVDPIVMAKCAIKDCHNGDNGDDKDWTEFNKFQANSDVVRFRVINGIMPPEGAEPLTADEIATIACWVDQGALNN